MNAADRLVAHLQSHDFDTLPPAVVEAAKVFILDAFGVGIAGSRHPRMAQVRQAMRALGTGDAATVWGSGETLPWAQAVLTNAYQVFNQEFDCIHDAAVVHAMASLLPACMGYAQAYGGVSGRELIAAVTLGLDVAIFVALAQRAPMRFFRPAMCGALGATAALAKLARLDANQTRDALGLAYSHLSGTMQAHVEGSPAVSMQVGFNARAAITAFELARAGFPGPRDILEGPFGYFALYDFGQADWASVQGEIGQVFQITRMSHKPYPSGRATHGGIEGVLQLMQRHGFEPDAVDSVQVFASALVVRLVGRAATPDMDPGYARLCMAYTVATVLLTGDLRLQDFDEAALRDTRRLALAQRVRLIDNANPDPNAIGGPQHVVVMLKDGTCHELAIKQLLGHPQRPLSLREQELKFERCCTAAVPPLPQRQCRELASMLRRLEEVGDVRALAAASTPAGAAAIRRHSAV
ncbi:MmgE/PrpD family protein [Azohydromonas australica]|uniref:MmgE/PrpD family protein n=1 Tax=Azohydromonas australica TaxID=364039 RepID=UPI00049194B7|nr:MmgE/PrpD family protein [Azohydromonas australica]